MFLIVALVLSALVGSIISGVLGMAGGTLLLALMLICGLDPVATVPIHAAVQLSSNVTRSVAHARNIHWEPVFILAAAALPGPLLGLWLLEGLDASAVRGVMGAVILYAVWAPKWGLSSLPDRAAFGLAGALAGTLGVVVGAVGPLIAPFFLREGFRKEAIIGTKAVCQAILHGVKIAAFAGLYPALLAAPPQDFRFGDHLALILPMAAATVVGTYVGKWLLGQLTERRFVLMYKAVLSLLALRLLYQSLFG